MPVAVVCPQLPVRNRGSPPAIARESHAAPGSALMVFKSVRNSLSSSVATWAFSGRVHHVTKIIPCISRAISTALYHAARDGSSSRYPLASRHGVRSGLLRLSY